MSMLPLFLIPFLLQFLVYGTNAECAIGDADQNAQWINSNGRLKIRDNDVNVGIGNDDYFLFQASCSENLEYEEVDEFCNCTFTNGTGVIYSCFAEYMDSLPNPNNQVPVDKLSLYAVRNMRNARQINSHQFLGYRAKEIRIEYMEALQLEERAFEGVQDLETLKLTHNNFGEMGHPDLIFAGLVNLTTLDLSYNQITGWKSAGRSSVVEPVLPKLMTLDLTGNPLVHLRNDTFEWLRGSQLRHLILQKCNLKSIETGALDPVESTIRTIDVGNSKIQRWLILNLIRHLASRSSLQGIALSKIGLTYIPYDVLKDTNGTLQYLSLHGNIFRNLSKDNLKRRKKSVLQAMKKNSTLSAYEKTMLQTPNKVFPYMPKLEELDLSKCSIYYIEKDIFTEMPNLKSLLLSQNQLVTFNTLNSPAFSQLRYLDLSKNPLYLYSLNFTYFPVLTTLDLSYTNLRKIFKNTFRTPSKKLKKLSMCYSKLSYIEDNSFINLDTLKILDLRGNNNLGQHLSTGTFNSLSSLEELHLAECTLKILPRISSQHNATIEMTPLQNITSLKRINLAKNNIKSIASLIIETLPELETLDLSNNYISSWDQPVFNNTRLRNLNVAHNYLNYITDAMLQDFRSLKTLIISPNPFVCDCNCVRFLDMLENATESSDSEEQGPPPEARIYEPNMKFISDNYRATQTNIGFKPVYTPSDDSNYFIRDWNKNGAYICLEKIGSDEVNYIPFQNVSCDTAKIQQPTPSNDDDTNNNDMTEVNDNEQVAIAAVAAALIITIAVGITYWKWWYIRYFAILVKNATVLSFMSHEEDASTDYIYNYDIFMSYSDHNREWVLNNLLPNLESKSKVKVCLHERDFQVGISILENIISSIDRSRCILLVISQSFLRSQWCQFELHLAQHRLLETRREELILLFLEEIPRMKRPKTLQYLMKTKTYIQWPKKEDDTEGQKLFWKRLHRAILRNTVEKEKKHTSIV